MTMMTGFPGVSILIVSLLKLIHASEIYSPETTNGERCIIPFSYKGNLYHDCVSNGQSRPWCFTEDSLRKWDYCKPHPEEFKDCKLATPNVTIDEIKEILDTHNTIRSELRALRMRKLSWNTELAQKAQIAANLCKHDHVEYSLCGERDTSGQNLYYSYNDIDYPELLSWKNVIHEWSGEAKYYNMKTDECQSGKLCGHFKQVAWDKTHLIGCGKAACYGNLNGKILYSIQYYCNYHQTGNIANDPPYIESASGVCQDCHLFNKDEKFRCDRQNLCETCNSKDLMGCTSFDEIKLLQKIQGSCSDTDIDCRHNIHLCDIYRKGIKMPQKILDYIQQCKKTCNLCS